MFSLFTHLSMFVLLIAPTTLKAFSNERCRLPTSQFAFENFLPYIQKLAVEDCKAVKKAKEQCLAAGGSLSECNSQLSAYGEFADRCESVSLKNNASGKRTLMAIEHLKNNNVEKAFSSPSALLKSIAVIHFILAPELKGQYRVENAFMPAYNCPFDGAISKEITDKVLGKRVSKEFWSAYDKVFSKGLPLSSLTEREARALSKVFYSTASPETISKRMLEMATRIVTQAKTVLSASETYALAAYAHNEIIRIHPYSDGNGRLARLVMNMLLSLKGENLFWPSSRGYTQIVKESIAKDDDLILANFVESNCLVRDEL